MIGERILLSYKKDIDLTILRPATVCGYSPSMRLDVAVNALTFAALNKRKIKVYGGKQIRPNLNIHDMVDVYKFFLKKKIKKDKHINETIFNVGFENLSILNIAKRINKSLKLKSKIFVEPGNDPRSYRQNSDKIISKGFKPQKKIEHAIKEIEEKFIKNKIKFNKKFYRINTLKIINKL